MRKVVRASVTQAYMANKTAIATNAAMESRVKNIITNAMLEQRAAVAQTAARGDDNLKSLVMGAMYDHDLKVAHTGADPSRRILPGSAKLGSTASGLQLTSAETRCVLDARVNASRGTPAADRMTSARADASRDLVLANQQLAMARATSQSITMKENHLSTVRAETAAITESNRARAIDIRSNRSRSITDASRGGAGADPYHTGFSYRGGAGADPYYTGSSRGGAGADPYSVTPGEVSRMASDAFDKRMGAPLRTSASRGGARAARYPEGYLFPN